MRSYILAIAVSMLLAAVYAFQNTAEVTVSFLLFRRAFPQGVWEVVLFSIGAVLMWFFSILASFETHKKYRKETRERDKRISELEEERTSLLNAFKYLPQTQTSEPAVPNATVPEAPTAADGAEAVTAEEHQEEEEKGSGSI